MHSTYENLPDELHIEEIAPCFENNSPELGNLVLTSTRLYNLFQPKRLIDKLLSYIAYGNQNAAEKMLTKHPELMLEKGSVIDPSGRHFKNISAFELALWTLDVRYMGRMMLDCIPKNEEEDKIRGQLLEQYNTFEEKGVTYTFENKTVTESHFDFNPLINALKTYAENEDAWSYDECKKHWCTVVGKEQTKLPMHVWHHYGDLNESFDPTPTFDKKRLKRNLKFYNYATNEEVFWSTGLIGLGVTFGIFRGRGSAQRVEGAPYEVDVDYAALSSLYKMRILDLELSKKQLVEPIQESYCVIL